MKLPKNFQSEQSQNQAFSWEPPGGEGICGQPLFGLATNFILWCAVNGTWGVSFPFSFICCSFFCISLHAHIEDNVHFKCGGRVYKNLFFFLFLYSILILSSILIFVFVSIFCLAVFYSVYFSISVSICCFYVFVSICCICFVLLFYCFYIQKIK